VTPAPGVVTRIARLREEGAVDAAAMVARAEELSALLSSWAVPCDRTQVMVAAVNVHGWYTALETLLGRVARLLDENVPQGPAWHADLLAQMATEVPGVRIALLFPEACRTLDQVRRFRHFFRNAYVLDFDGDRVQDEARRVVALHDPIFAQIQRLQADLARLLDELA